MIDKPVTLAMKQSELVKKIKQESDTWGGLPMSLEYISDMLGDLDPEDIDVLYEVARAGGKVL